MHRPLLGSLPATLVVLVALVALAPPAAAHAGFDWATPGDTSVVQGPVAEVRVAFTAPVEPAGSGFEVLDPTGTVVTPEATASDDGRVWTLFLDPALAHGDVGVRWQVAAPDAHPISGTFSFSISDSPDPSEGVGAAKVAGTTEIGPASATRPSAARSEPVDLSDFLRDNATPVSIDRLLVAGRFLGLLGTLLGVGALVFAATVLRGSPGDVRHVVYWVRRLGIVALVGATLELAGVLALAADGAWTGVWRPSVVGPALWAGTGAALGLRGAGGLLLAFGPRMVIAAAAEVPDSVARVRAFAGVGASAPLPPAAAHTLVDGVVHPREAAWRSTSESAGAFVGAALLVAASAFDGHTVSEGSRVLTATLATAHVVGAAVWVGGAVMLAFVLWRRHLQGRDLRALTLALRFSVVATVALAVVAAAGVVLSFTILDAPSGLWATEWGRLLVAKTLLVAVAMLLGGYNHQVLIPALAEDRVAPWARRRFRYVVAAEGCVLVSVVVVTALLVGASA